MTHRDYHLQYINHLLNLLQEIKKDAQNGRWRYLVIIAEQTLDSIKQKYDQQVNLRVPAHTIVEDAHELVPILDGQMLILLRLFRATFNDDGDATSTAPRLEGACMDIVDILKATLANSYCTRIHAALPPR